jgi:hypothetical protein
MPNGIRVWCIVGLPSFAKDANRCGADAIKRQADRLPVEVSRIVVTTRYCFESDDTRHSPSDSCAPTIPRLPDR